MDITFYEGDTFDINFNLDIRDATGRPYVLKPTDIVRLRIRDKGAGKVIIEEAFNNIADNKVKLVVDQEMSANFSSNRGYEYSLKLESQFVKTIIPVGKIYVRRVV